MKWKYWLITLIFLCVFSSVKAWPNDSFDKGRTLTFTYGGTAIKNYQIDVSCSWGDCDISRIYDGACTGSGNPINAQDLSDNSSTITFKYDVVNGANVFCALYENNTPVGYQDNPDFTWNISDDFPGSSLNTSKWTVEEGAVIVGGGYAQIDGTDAVYSNTNLGVDTLMSFRWNVSSGSNGARIGVADASHSGNLGSDLIQSSTASSINYLLVKNGGSGGATSSTLNIASLTNITNIWFGANATMHINNNYNLTDGTDVPDINDYHPFWFMSRDSVVYIDWIKVRKFTNSTQTMSVGVEELQSNSRIYNPLNQTYYTDDIDAVFNFSNNGNPTFELNVSLNGTVIYSNLSYVAQTNVTIALDNYLDSGFQNLTVNTNDSSSSVYFTVDLTYPQIIVTPYDNQTGFVTAYSSIIEFNVSDDISTTQTCNISINNVNHTNQLFSNNATNYSYEILHGSNRFFINCSDGNKTNSTTLLRTYYAVNFTLIDEDTGGIFTNFSAMDTLRFISEDNGSEFDFLNNNNTSVLFIWNSSENLRLDKVYNDLPTSPMYSDLKLALLDNSSRICVANPQNFYEIIFYSSTGRDITVLNNFANCHVLASATSYAYQDALMSRAFTINALYYLYLLDDGNLVLLSSLDGSVAISVALDILEFSSQTSALSLEDDVLSFNNLGNSTLLIYYQNSAEDNSQISVQIFDGTTQILSHTETSNPNNMTLYFDYTSLTLNNDLLTFILNTTTTSGVFESVTRIFNLHGETGLINTNVAIVFSVGLIFFGLTFVAINSVFGWFGILMCVISIGMTSFAIPTDALRLVQGLEVILAGFILLIWRGENTKIT